MNQIDVTTPLVDFHGKPIESGETVCGGCKRPIAPMKMIAREVFLNALVAERPGETISGADKINRYRLGMRIAAADKIELTADEIVLLKSQVEKFYTALIYGQICDLLER